MALISKWKVPPGGWFFVEGQIRLEEQTFDDLVRAITNHRKNNHKEAGNPEREAMIQIYERTGALNQAAQPNLMTKAVSLGNALLAWVRGGGKLVDQNTANIRAATCRQCHNNQPNGGSACKTCGGNWFEDAAVAALRPLIIGGRTTTSNGSLMACALCGCDLKTKVWFPREALGVNKENENAYPTFCFLKQA